MKNHLLSKFIKKKSVIPTFCFVRVRLCYYYSAKVCGYITIYYLKMNYSSAFSLLNIRRQLLLSFKLTYPKNNYAKKETGGVSMVGGILKKKKMGKMGPTVEKKVLPVETDPNKLVKFVCGSNIFKTGEDVMIKPDSEYPDWLWSLRTGPAPKLHELDPNTMEYWLLVRKLGRKRNNMLAQLRKFN